MRTLRAGKWVLAVLVLAGFGGAGYWKWTALRTEQLITQLADVGPADRETLANALAARGEAAVPSLLQKLDDPHPLVCANTEAALMAVSKPWQAGDPRALRLAADLHAKFGGMSKMGQGSALVVLASLLRRDPATQPPAAMIRAAAELLQAAEPEVELRGHALVLGAALAERVPDGPWMPACRALADRGLSDATAKTRLAAVELIMRSELRQEQTLLVRLVRLLRDESAVVRRAAVVALAPARDRASEDDLIPLLHDDDAEVRRLCEAALRSRGLPEEHIALARLISDERPSARLRVLERLGYERDLDPTVWLRRLTQDSSPAVRAAAVRAAGQDPQLAGRLRELAQDDPSETVRQNARHYLQQSERRPEGESAEQR